MAAVYAFPLPAYSRVAEGRGDAPPITATAELEIRNLTCRGSAALFAYFLERDDEYALDGYLKIEAWPGPGAVPARITYDPEQANPMGIKEAITEPYFDAVGNVWRTSPFEVSGYDPLGLTGGSEAS
ncbi:MAG: hypothetical protein GY778_28545 [bacterium]|nr:hypothetical protein [bacterium]